MKRIPIIFLAANPENDTRLRLRLDEDQRRIKEKLGKARYRGVLEFNLCPAARLGDLVQALHDTPPRIVHFSGHGNSTGIMLVGENGTSLHCVGAEELKKLFMPFRDGISVVVLSACSTAAQAAAIAKIVGCAIGTSGSISDEAAIEFNAEFYRAIAFGESVRGAYDKACGVMGAKRFDSVLPVIEAGPGVDPAQLFLVTKPARHRRWLAASAAIVAATALALNQMPPSTPLPVYTHLPAGEAVRIAVEFYKAGNPTAAFPLFKQAAEAGNTEAMGYLGTAYLWGEGTARTPELAVRWLSLAAHRGDARGMNGYGAAFEVGFGVAQDPALARRWYERAAEENHPEAMRNLGRLHREGRGTPRNDSLALAWYRRAIDAGSVEAIVDVGVMHAEGVYGQRDAGRAIEELERAANLQSVRAMHALGRLHGDIGAYGPAATWYRKAAAAGSADAMTDLGRMYQNGWGVPPDDAEAARWYRRAVQAGSTVAAGHLTTLRQR